MGARFLGGTRKGQSIIISVFRSTNPIEPPRKILYPPQVLMPNLSVVICKGHCIPILKKKTLLVYWLILKFLTFLHLGLVWTRGYTFYGARSLNYIKCFLPFFVSRICQDTRVYFLGGPYIELHKVFFTFFVSRISQDTRVYILE